MRDDLRRKARPSARETTGLRYRTCQKDPRKCPSDSAASMLCSDSFPVSELPQRESSGIPPCCNYNPGWESVISSDVEDAVCHVRGLKFSRHTSFRSPLRYVRISLLKQTTNQTYDHRLRIRSDWWGLNKLHSGWICRRIPLTFLLRPDTAVRP